MTFFSCLLVKQVDLSGERDRKDHCVKSVNRIVNNYILQLFGRKIGSSFGGSVHLIKETERINVLKVIYLTMLHHRNRNPQCLNVLRWAPLPQEKPSVFECVTLGPITSRGILSIWMCHAGSHYLKWNPQYLNSLPNPPPQQESSHLTVFCNYQKNPQHLNVSFHFLPLLQHQCLNVSCQVYHYQWNLANTWMLVS